MSKKIPLPSKHWFEIEYIEKKRTASQIAAELGRSQGFVLRGLKKYGVPRRSAWEERKHWDKEWLHEQYCVLGKTAVQIGKESGVVKSVILQTLKKFGIPRRTSEATRFTKGQKSQNSKDLDREWLEREYIQKNRSTIEIAKDAGCSCQCVRRALHRFGIPVRDTGRKGELSSNWKGGTSTARGLLAGRREWKLAVKCVVKRDQCCRLCALKGIINTNKRQIHHIDRFAEAMLLWCDPGNLIWLCKEHHDKMRGKERRWMRRLFKLIEQPLVLPLVNTSAATLQSHP